MILFQVRDLAAKSCGEPHVAPSWEIAKASLGAMLAKSPELAERAHAIKIEYLGEFDPETGFDPMVQIAFQFKADGEYCLAEFRAACVKEEQEKQAEADNLTEDEKQQIFEKQCDVSNIIDAAERRKK